MTGAIKGNFLWAGSTFVTSAPRSAPSSPARDDMNIALKTVWDEQRGKQKPVGAAMEDRAAVHSNGIQFLSYLLRREADPMMSGG